MARRRRLRHKLMLGLGVLVGSVGLLLVGTLYGLHAYQDNARTTDRKIEELQNVRIFIEALTQADPAAPDPLADKDKLLARIDHVRPLLGYCQKFHAETVAAGLDPDGGRNEADLLRRLDDGLRDLERAVRQAGTPTMDSSARSPLAAQREAHLRQTFDRVRDTAAHLHLAVIDDIQRSGRGSARAVRQSLWVIGFATAWVGVILVALVYYFREWMFAPIRAIQGGVQRVHAGDFDHPIAISSGDELEELAAEFNAMTARVSATYRDLARQVNERSRQLVRSERMVSVGFLAAGVAHEINNPLASILFCAEALERRLHDVLADGIPATRGADPADADVLTRYLKMIQQEALRCKDITQKLLDFSRTGDRKREPTDLGGLIQGVLEVARHLPNCRGKTIAFAPDHYIVAPVNAQDLKSVILNLVVNALDSTDDGGRLSITLGAAGGQAEMVFADTGCGMPPDVLQNIFEPFYTRSRTGKGTGLGLFISHQIIDQHGGQIEAASPGPGRGSTFTVRVPLTENRSQEAGDRSPGGPAEPATAAVPGLAAGGSLAAGTAPPPDPRPLGDPKWRRRPPPTTASASCSSTTSSTCGSSCGPSSPGSGTT